ncbi:BON domain-containing protein [Chamaesiphon sp. OTE_8_metabat_110]|uniref:BON domain-containing protein n=1 Tax=Chamaesiphon sp. OTE_8_metabat_110 TaxID=2964696 RepID=UPI00286D4AE0|nr:BON domain-containing protein [Chamaesiphon sp. OTE_8_metabat_110]
MLFSSLQTKLIGLLPIALLALTACNQAPTPADPRATGDSVVTTAPANNSAANTAPVANVDDAAEQVEEALDNHPTLRAFDLDANDENNSIVLTGRVQTEAQKQLAQTLTQQLAPGVAIVNQIVF